MTAEEFDNLALAIGRNVLLAQKEVLTLEEAALYAGVEKSQIYKWTSEKTIPHYKPTGKKCFFKRTELEEWLLRNRVATLDELNDRAQEYCMRKKSIL